MKNPYTILLSTGLFLLCSSCDKLKDDPSVLGGDPSPMGAVGVTVASSSVEIAGISNFQATVTTLTDGISSFGGSATVTNQIIRDLFTNIPGITASGNTVTGTDVKFKQTTDGIELISGSMSGILVKYGSSVGDTYAIGSTGKVRTVVGKSETDDYPYGLMLIKTIQVEETGNQLKSSGILKITYISNHRFGLVGLRVSFNDGTSVYFPVYTSAENN